MEFLKRILLVLGMVCLAVGIYVVSDPTREYIPVLLNLLVIILLGVFGLLLLIWHLEDKRER